MWLVNKINFIALVWNVFWVISLEDSSVQKVLSVMITLAFSFSDICIGKWDDFFSDNDVFEH